MMSHTLNQPKVLHWKRLIILELGDIASKIHCNIDGVDLIKKCVILLQLTLNLLLILNSFFIIKIRILEFE